MKVDVSVHLDFLVSVTRNHEELIFVGRVRFAEVADIIADYIGARLHGIFLLRRRSRAVPDGDVVCIYVVLVSRDYRQFVK